MQNGTLGGRNRRKNQGGRESWASNRRLNLMSETPKIPILQYFREYLHDELMYNMKKNYGFKREIILHLAVSRTSSSADATHLKPY